MLFRSYWSVPSLARLQAATSLRWVNNAGALDWPVGDVAFSYSFHTAVSAWLPARSAPSGVHLAGRDASGELLVVDFARLTQSGGVWRGSITYLYTTDQHLLSFGPNGVGSFTTSTATRYPLSSWYTIVSVPGI